MVPRARVRVSPLVVGAAEAMPGCGTLTSAHIADPEGTVVELQYWMPHQALKQFE
jgi:hypothetical protein